MNGYILGVFVVSLFLAAIGFLVFSRVVEAFLGLDVALAGMVVTAMLPPMSSGEAWYRKIGRVPTNFQAWQAAVAFTLVQIVFATLILSFATPLFDPNNLTILGSLGAGEWSASLGVAIAVVFLISRFSYSMGARNKARHHETRGTA